jgi:hypothetical protein
MCGEEILCSQTEKEKSTTYKVLPTIIIICKKKEILNKEIHHKKKSV